MAIKFKEDRQLLSGEIVKKDETRTFDPIEEAAFIANGVADPVELKTQNSKLKTSKEEVTDNG